MIDFLLILLINFCLSFKVSSFFLTFDLNWTLGTILGTCLGTTFLDFCTNKQLFGFPNFLELNRLILIGIFWAIGTGPEPRSKSFVCKYLPNE